MEDVSLSTVSFMFFAAQRNHKTFIQSNSKANSLSFSKYSDRFQPCQFPQSFIDNKCNNSMWANANPIGKETFVESRNSFRSNCFHKTIQSVLIDHSHSF